MQKDIEHLRMEDAYQIASKKANKDSARGKAHYDKKVQGGDLQIGGTGKIQSYWEDEVYQVKERRGFATTASKSCTYLQS